MKKRVGRARRFVNTYTAGLTRDDVRRLFTRDTPEAYRFFSRGIDEDALAALPRRKRVVARARMLFLAFAMRLSPVRRLIYGIALVAALIGLFEQFAGFTFRHGMLLPVSTPGLGYLLIAFLLVNLLVILEVADRLSLKNDLEIARDIQLAMLPGGVFRAGDVEAFGMTRPANTVGGDFYDILPLSDGRILVTLGDVSGKGSPAALLMALLLAIFRTLVDEGLDPPTLASRLNGQMVRHTPASRFVTLFFAIYDPVTGAVCYVNAGHLPPLVCRANGRIERLPGGGIALGMFDASTYQAEATRLDPGDLLVMYSDGITEAENRGGQQFEDTGLERVLSGYRGIGVEELARQTFKAVEQHAGDMKLYDDLTILALRRLPTTMPANKIPPIVV